jgi:hypothetical protein
MGSEALSIWGSLWVQTLGDVLIPLAADLAAKTAAGGKREGRAFGQSLRVAVRMLCKALLHYLPLLSPDPEFPALWLRFLQTLQARVVTLMPEWKRSPLSYENLFF